MKKRSGDSSRLGDVSEMLMQKPPLGTPLDWDNPLNDGCVMHLAMNEGHGDKVQDLSMNRNHGTLNNFAFPPTGASGWNPGQTGVGLNFDGTDDYIDCGGNASLKPVSPFSISMILRADDLPEFRRVVTNIDIGNKRGYDIFLDDVGRATFQVGIGTGYKTARTDNVVDDNLYHNIICTWAGAELRTYIDGAEADYHLQETTASYTQSTNNTLIGKYSGGGHLTASVDQVRLQSRAWSAKEVKDYAMNPWQVYLQ